MSSCFLLNISRLLFPGHSARGLDDPEFYKENRKGKEGSGPPIGDPNPFTEVAGTHRGRWRPQWRGQGRRLAVLTQNRLRTPSRKSPIDLGLGSPIRDPNPDPDPDLDLDPSTEVAGTHGGRWPP
ncbi:hypothetical protein CRG98_014311 [Punica granatum]|uniref:Uncharacterized protein n=1 Tax=Punica granatum TaxID=22663 RepID=A0A2I0KAW5_PUNGR|nr:hypothetical protein CRG98_014311 [Punica granatum]